MPAPKRKEDHGLWRSRIAASQRRRLASSGVWNKGLKGQQRHSLETKAKMSRAHKDKWSARTDAERKLHSAHTSAGLRDAIRDGRFSGMKGHRHKDATKKKISASNSTPEMLAKHSRNYSKYTSRQTKPEMILGDLLDARRWKFVGACALNDGTHNPNWLKYALPISADFVHRPSRTMVMVDGCYWHECPHHGVGKFPEKRIRDEAISNHARSLGWVVIRIWEHEIYDDASSAADYLNTGARSWLLV